MKSKRNYILAIVVFTALIGVFVMYNLFLKVECLRCNVERNNSSLVMVFYDSNDKAVARATLIKLAENPPKLGFTLSHEENSKIRRLMIKLTPDIASTEIYLKTPEQIWNPIKLHRSKDGFSSVLEISDLDAQGEGTIKLNFIILPLEKTDVLSVYLDVEFDMEKGLQKYSGIGQGVLRLSLS